MDFTLHSDRCSQKQCTWLSQKLTYEGNLTGSDWEFPDQNWVNSKDDSINRRWSEGQDSSPEVSQLDLWTNLAKPLGQSQFWFLKILQFPFLILLIKL